MSKVAILVTCHNRRETTLACLEAISLAVGDSCTWQIVLVDDGSNDGTSDAVEARWPDAVVVRANGDLFWNGGMRLAWETALPMCFDFYLWLNDDTNLIENSISDMLSLYRKQISNRSIVVGKTIDPNSRKVTYGGYRRKERSISKLKFRRLFEEEQECHTMNGNCVLFPAIAAKEIGINSDRYRHAFGDNDYGLRAWRAGYKLIEMKRPVALQERNSEYQQSTGRLSIRNWRYIMYHPKGVPLKEWFWFCRNHAGFIWPLNFVFRYIKMMRS